MAAILVGDVISENVLTENEAHTTQHKAELNDDNQLSDKIICDDSLVSDNEGNKDIINSPLKRPVRTKTVPAKFKDFVMEK